MAKNEATTIDLLLGVDEKKLKKPSKKVEITRLSEAVGEPVYFTCEAIEDAVYEDIQNSSIINNGDDEPDLDVNKMQLFTVLEGVTNPSLKSEKLRDKFGVPTPIDVIKKLLYPGERNKLYEIISELSGFGNKAVKEIKN